MVSSEITSEPAGLVLVVSFAVLSAVGAVLSAVLPEFPAQAVSPVRESMAVQASASSFLVNFIFVSS